MDRQTRDKVSNDRRAFLKEVAVAGGALLSATAFRGLTAPNASAQFGQASAAPVVSTSPWSQSKIGLELFTVRDVMSGSQELHSHAGEGGSDRLPRNPGPAGGYGGLDPAEFLGVT